ncbi:hypothetical protein HDV00_004114 [Rhizophlyctis rosea]|nr:hypothetical protein HDV00_004114 [Rhizophlyctis rosea]
MEDTNTEFRIGLTSKYPLTVIERRKEGFWHGLLVVRVELSATRYLNIALTHLNPFSATDRKKECQQIISTIQSSPHATEEWIMAGDLNSLSSLDATFYSNTHLISAFATNDKLAQKFLTEDRKSIDYSPLDVLEDGGLHDLSQMRDGKRQALNHLDHSVPTGLEVDAMHATKMRLDYVFGNDRVARDVRRCGVLRTGETEVLSDHYPVVLEFD